MTNGSSIDIGPFHFTAIRILVSIGVLRVILRGERIAGKCNMLDRSLIVWGLWAVTSSLLHKDIAGTLVFRLGLVYNALGSYFLLRIFIADWQTMVWIFKATLFLLVPVAVEMIVEHFTGRNGFAVLGGVSEVSEVRAGKIRAQGPFQHSILAGTVGAACLPVAAFFWRNSRGLAVVGGLSTVAVVYASRSSGPIMTAMFVLFGLVLWRIRQHLRLIRWGVLLGIFALSLVMKAPVYYVLDRIDLTGSSTGWHRAILIEAAIKHLNEWWACGTDYTVHWTPNAGWGDDTDITNYYIRMGVWGGLPLMLVFIATLAIAFRAVGKALNACNNASAEQEFLAWTLGTMLFGHAATMISVSYFDQSVVFLYLVLAAIGSIQALLTVKVALARDVEPDFGSLSAVFPIREEGGIPGSD
jgi:hypothetical protein